MGLDLTLAYSPWRSDQGAPEPLLYSRLSLNRDYELFDQIKELPVIPVTGPVLWYGDEGLETRETDPYGDRLTWVNAFHFHNVKGSENSENAAILAFVRTMPPDRRIYLWWH
jgi:hypothetical protein